jgi:deoxyribonuclease V
MRWDRLHPWEVTAEQAEAIQCRLASRIAAEPDRPLGEWSLVAGAVVAGRAAAVAVMDIARWALVETARVEFACSGDACYQRGLMAFAFGPPLLSAFSKIESQADIALFRAHGRAHPRRLGMASHLGFLLGVPSVGCGEALLCGELVAPGAERGDWAPVTDGSEIIGAAVRTRAGSRPLFVSPGYRMSVREAVQVAMRCVREHRLPEPLRQARLIARGGGAHGPLPSLPG